MVQREAFVACQGSLDHIDPQLVFKGVPSCRVFSTLSYSSFRARSAASATATAPKRAVRRHSRGERRGAHRRAATTARHVREDYARAASSDGRPGLVANRLRGDVQEHPWQAKSAQGVQRGLHRLPEVARKPAPQSITVENNLARIDTDTSSAAERASKWGIARPMPSANWCSSGCHGEAFRATEPNHPLVPSFLDRTSVCCAARVRIKLPAVVSPIGCAGGRARRAGVPDRNRPPAPSRLWTPALTLTVHVVSQVRR